MHYCTLILVVICFACNNPEPVGSNNLEAVKNILATERRAHLEKDVSLLLSNGKDTVLEVNRGFVKWNGFEDSRKRFSNYFSSVEFIKWDDAAEPIFFFSDDSTMAAVTVQKQVILKEISTGLIDTTDYAWTSVFRKQEGRWKLVVITSTDK